ncbi:hypothetical protein EU527_16785 [Candidatus Thorarchaeota archaeon]|nr:MAG: hypothetical protein EU527_16785 [Candidatus Thorarchaeota archaeon]
MSEKISVKVFLPVGVCSCSITGFLGRIYEAVKKYRDAVDYSEDIATSRMAKEVGVMRQGVLVGSKYFEGNVTAANLESAILEELAKKNKDSHIIP